MRTHSNLVASDGPYRRTEAEANLDLARVRAGVGPSGMKAALEQLKEEVGVRRGGRMRAVAVQESSLGAPLG